MRTANAVWDESGNFVLYPTMLGIKGNWPNMIQSIFQADIYLVVNAVTNKVARVLGKDETLRFLNIALYQGAPAKKGVTTIQMAASANPCYRTKHLETLTSLLQHTKSKDSICSLAVTKSAYLSS